MCLLLSVNSKMCRAPGIQPQGRADLEGAEVYVSADGTSQDDSHRSAVETQRCERRFGATVGTGNDQSSDIDCEEASQRSSGRVAIERNDFIDQHHHNLTRDFPASSNPGTVEVRLVASRIKSVTRSGAVYIGLWSTRSDRMLAPMRSAMKRCAFGLIMRSSSASRYHEGFAFHAGTGARS